MSTRAYYRPSNIEIDLASSLPTPLFREITRWHGHSDKMKDPPILTCLGNSEPMYISYKNGRFFPTHYPHGNPDGHGHTHLVTMSDEHRRQTDYTERAASDHGLEAVKEHSTGNGTRLDLAVVGAEQVGFEIQRSNLSRVQARRRTALSFEAGWPTAWVTDQQRAPDWSGTVPTARLTAGIDWQAMPPANTVRAVIAKYHRERDRSRPSGWRYVGEPHAVLLDELAYLMPAGEIVPVAIGTKGGVALAFRDAVDVIDSCTYQGASTWWPTARTTRDRENVQRIQRDCEQHPTKDSPVFCTSCGQRILYRPDRYTVCVKCSGRGPIIRKGS